MAARRVILPSADDLFRPTVKDPSAPAQQHSQHSGTQANTQADTQADTQGSGPSTRQPSDPAGGQGDGEVNGHVNGRKPTRPSGRVRHDEKMTVYITSDELLEIEHARLALRRTHGLAVDRGRLVREAVAIVLADLEAHGSDCALVRRLADG